MLSLNGRAISLQFVGDFLLSEVIFIHHKVSPLYQVVLQR